MADGADIIIKGGSVELDYNDDQYPKNNGRRKNESKKITRVVITGDINYDSDEHNNGLLCNITVTCK